MRKVAEIAWREFRATVMTKAFLIAAVVLPVVMWGMAILLPVLLHAPPRPLDGTLAIVDADGRVTESLAKQFEPEAVKARQQHEREQYEEELTKPLPPAMRDVVQGQLDHLLEKPLPKVTLQRVESGSQLEELKTKLRTGELLGVVAVDPEILTVKPDKNHCDLYLRESVTRRNLEDLENAVKSAVVDARASQEKLDKTWADSVLARPAVLTSTVTKSGGEARENEVTKIFVPLAFMLLIWTSTWMTGQYLLTSTIEEKSNRVVEVLLSAISPLELLSGKIIGQCCVGLLTISLYGGFGVSAAVKFGYAHLVPPDKLAFLLLYFAMAYFMVASTMAAVGAAVNELREAQTLLGPVAMIFMVPLFAWFFITENPNSPFATAISFIPPMTPFAMILRVTALEPVPTWQIVATTLVGFAGVLGMVWAAARIFRVGILMTGKAPTPAELFKWIRYA